MLRTETKQCDKRDVDVPTFRVACHIVTVTAIEQYHVRLHALNTRKTHLCTIRFCLLKKSLINQSQYSVVCFDEVNVGLLPLVNNEPCANSFLVLVRILSIYPGHEPILLSTVMNIIIC